MLPSILIRAAVERALMEDLAGGDLTTEATVDAATCAVGRAVAQAPLVACGADVFAAVFTSLDPGVRIERLVDDGTFVPAGTELWIVEGSARSILTGERTALNFVQRLSGIASQARRFVAALPPGSRTRITDTRKTTPGLRAFERYAVRCGGAHNHRDSLGAGVLIKDNHLEAAGGIAAAVTRARARAPHGARIEVEVESLAMLDEALAAGAEVVMLDNFPPDALRAAIERARGRALVEVSGGVTLERITELAALGVDVVSVGALTHSVAASDISLDVTRLGS